MPVPKVSVLERVDCNYDMYVSKMVTIYLLYRTDGLVNRKENSVVAKRSSAYQEKKERKCNDVIFYL